MENLFIVERSGDDVIIKDIAERKYAEDNGLRHLTVICVIFTIEDGKWLLQNRYKRYVTKAKAAKKPIPAPYDIFNTLGGHCTPGTNDQSLIGEKVTEALLYESLRKELSEELLTKADRTPFPIPLFAPIPIGLTEHNAPNNIELSYYFALPMTTAQSQQIYTADDVVIDGVKENIIMEHKCFSQSELVALKAENKLEDAITRLYDNPANHKTLQKLRETIDVWTLKK